MKLKTCHTFTSKNLDLFDLTIPFAYRRLTIWDFRKANIKKSDILNAVIYANKVVGNYLRSV